MTTQFLRCAGLALALAGCAGPIRPTVGPTVSSLPDQPERRDQLLASTAVVSTEARGSASKAEPATVAATLAAFIGMFFSADANTFVGLAVPIEENTLVTPRHEARPRPRAEQAEPAE
jgi:hypothetical protein